MVTMQEAVYAGRVFIGGAYQASYTTFRGCIFLGPTLISGPGNQVVKCYVIGAGKRQIDCTPELRGRRN